MHKPVAITADLAGYSQSSSSTWNPKAPVSEVTIVLFQRPTFHRSVFDPDGKPAIGAQVMIVEGHGFQDCRKRNLTIIVYLYRSS